MGKKSKSRCNNGNTGKKRELLHTKPIKLRFDVGQRVVCCVGEGQGLPVRWAQGTVIKHWFRHFEGVVFPYQVQLDNDDQPICAPVDDDRCIRKLLMCWHGCEFSSVPDTISEVVDVIGLTVGGMLAQRYQFGAHTTAHVTVLGAALTKVREDNIDTFDDLWHGAEHCEIIKSSLISMGTEYILSGNPRDIDMAIVLALAIISVDEKGASIMDLISGLTSKAYAKTLRDLNEGGERAAIRFYAPRIECDCLKEKYQQSKTLPSIGMCSGCWRSMDRSKLLLCSRCRVGAQYCSTACQTKNWADHRPVCDHHRNAEKMPQAI